jgi:OmpA family protein
MSARNASLALASAVALLAGCATIPTGPRVMALPGSSKTFEQFQADGYACQSYAQQTVGASGQAANNAATSSAVAGTLIGAAAGAAIGAASGNAGPGAAIGAGTGLLFGSANGAGASGWSTYGLQRSYDNAYLQCMYAKGNQVPMPAGYGARRAYPYPPPPPGSYPPPGYYGGPPPAS